MLRHEGETVMTKTWTTRTQPMVESEDLETGLRSLNPAKKGDVVKVEDKLVTLTTNPIRRSPGAIPTLRLLGVWQFEGKS